MKYNDYLKTLTTCPFCDSEKVRIIENDTAFLTYSVAPYHPDHLLVIPKRHVEHILELSEQEIKDIDSLQKMGLQTLNKLGYSNMCILVKEGDKTEKTIAHTHYHLIPDVVIGDADHTGIDTQVMSAEDVGKLISRINSVLKL